MPDAACDALASAGPSSDEPVGAEATGNVRGRKKEAPAEQETAAEFTVNSVVGSRMVEGQLEYEVKWTREEVMPAHACLALGNCCFGGDLPTREVEMSTWELADDMYNCDGLIHDYHTLEPNSISAQRPRSIAAGGRRPPSSGSSRLWPLRPPGERWQRTPPPSRCRAGADRSRRSRPLHCE